MSYYGRLYFRSDLEDISRVVTLAISKLAVVAAVQFSLCAAKGGVGLSCWAVTFRLCSGQYVVLVADRHMDCPQSFRVLQSSGTDAYGFGSRCHGIVSCERD